MGVGDARNDVAVVLVVDEDLQIRRLIEQILRKEGHIILQADDGI
jgi:CheY-like chemotaxis protein